MAVKVTVWPQVEGFDDELVSLVVVLILLTVWPPVRGPLLVAKLVSPLYVAVMVWGPPVRTESVMEALP